MKTIKVVAAVIRDKNRIFATQRGYGDLKGVGNSLAGRSKKGKLHRKL